MHILQQGYVFHDAAGCRRGCCCAIHFVPERVKFFESDHLRQLTKKEPTWPALMHFCNAEQLMALAMSIEPCASPIQPCELSILLTFKVAKNT